MITKFDGLLGKISHYQHYPAMMPIVGDYYGEGPLQKILLIGESNYLPETSTVHLNAEQWYSGKEEDLTEQEQEWIHNRNLVGGDWAPRAHMIYRELSSRISEVAAADGRRGMDNVAYMNGFQRPARTGDSIKNILTHQDAVIAQSVIREVVIILQPNTVIFTSILAWDYLGKALSKQDSERVYERVCHPGTGGRYWHKTTYGHGVQKFRTLIENSRIE